MEFCAARTRVVGVYKIGAGGCGRSVVGRLRFRHSLGDIMKAILSVALVLGVGGAGVAADEKDQKKAGSPVGTWSCDYAIGEMKRTSSLTIKKDGDKLVGVMNWPDQKNEKLKDVKFKDGTLTFSAVRKFMDNEIPIDYTLKIEGDKFKGKGASDFGGQTREFEITGKREKEKKVEKKEEKEEKKGESK